MGLSEINFTVEGKPSEVGPEKPNEGEKCNGCGFCCATERCQAAIIAIGDGPGPCPLLVFGEGRFWCGLVVTEKEAGLEPLIANALGIGTGCFTENKSE